MILKRISRQRYIKRVGMLRNKKAILLSGGMDSIALAYWLRPEVAITLDYGQKAAEAEIAAAARVAQLLRIRALCATDRLFKFGQWRFGRL